MASDHIQEIEKKCYASNRLSLELLGQVRTLETEVARCHAEIYRLRMLLDELNIIYIPLKTCPIDVKLSEYINTYPDRKKLKIMFMRESEGVYEFGSRKVHVRCDRGKITIKVGGGFISIDEFLD